MRGAAVQWPFKVIQGGAASPGLVSAGSVAASSGHSHTSLGRGRAQAGPVSEVHHMAESSNSKDARAPNVKARAVSLLAQREYSRQALQEKLVSENASPEEVEQALAQLEAKGLVDDTRVVETLVNRRAGKLGGMRLRQELQAKGVSPELVAETMAGLKAGAGFGGLAEKIRPRRHRCRHAQSASPVFGHTWLLQRCGQAGGGGRRGRLVIHWGQIPIIHWGQIPIVWF